MSTLRIVVQHNLTVEAVATRIRENLVRLAIEHSDKMSDIKESWTGNSADLSFVLLKPLRLSISANLRLTADQVILEGPLPLVVWPFKGKIEDALREHLKACLG